MYGENVIIAGRQAGCPFCLARGMQKPKVGDRVILLSNYRAGRKGTVSKVRLDKRYPKTTFLIRADGDEPNVEQIVNMDFDLCMLVKNNEPFPNWLPPLCLRECSELEEVVVAFCIANFFMGKWKWNQRAFWRVIHLVWSKRLPLAGDEIWQVVEAHGAPSSARTRVQRQFTEGTGLLVYTHGRPPIKKKRVAPMTLIAEPSFRIKSRQGIT